MPDPNVTATPIMVIAANVNFFFFIPFTPPFFFSFVIAIFPVLQSG
jgi:hypothetical protein